MTTDNPQNKPLAKASIYLSVRVDEKTGEQIFSDARSHPNYKVVKPSSFNANMALFVLWKQVASQYPAKPAQVLGLKAFAAFVAGGYNQEDGCSWPNFDTITESAGISRTSATRYSKLLHDSGLWGVVPGTGNKSTRYYPLFLEGGNKQYIAYLKKKQEKDGDDFPYDLEDIDPLVIRSASDTTVPEAEPEVDENNPPESDVRDYDDPYSGFQATYSDHDYNADEER